jgi:hypothetical protein
VTVEREVDRVTLWMLLGSVLSVSTAYGMLLLLPLYVKTDIGGDEADFGVITAAGAVTAMLAIGLLIRFPRTFPPHHVVSIAAAAYAAAAVGVSMMHAMGWPLVALGLVLGTTWALAYTASPMVVSELVGDRSRARYIGYVTGSIQIGFGLGPIVGSALQDLGFALETVFRVAAGLAVAAAVVAAPLHRRAPALSLRLAAVGPPGQPLGRALVTIVRSRAAIPLVMVLICACLFTTMNTFQTTFGDARSLDYDVFFASYTAAVIAARFGIVRWLPDSSSPHVLAVSTAGVVASIALFLAVGTNTIAYAAASASLGLTYGLTLPAVQARAVNLSGADVRPRLLPLVGLVFETAILAFPLAAGAIISATDYTTMFVVLLGLALALAALGQLERARVGRPVLSPADAPLTPVPGPTAG